MAKTNHQSVDEYIASRPEQVQPALRKVRTVIRKALPKAEEVISYQIAAYRLNKRIVVYFAGWTEHYSIYPAGERLLAAFPKELAGYKISKGTIRFPLTEPVPVKLIERLVKFRAKELASKD